MEATNMRVLKTIALMLVVLAAGLGFAALMFVWVVWATTNAAMPWAWVFNPFTVLVLFSLVLLFLAIYESLGKS